MSTSALFVGNFSTNAQCKQYINKYAQQSIAIIIKHDHTDDKFGQQKWSHAAPWNHIYYDITDSKFNST